MSDREHDGALREAFDGMMGEGYWDSCAEIREANRARQEAEADALIDAYVDATNDAAMIESGERERRRAALKSAFLRSR